MITNKILEEKPTFNFREKYKRSKSKSSKKKSKSFKNQERVRIVGNKSVQFAEKLKKQSKF